MLAMKIVMVLIGIFQFFKICVGRDFEKHQHIISYGNFHESEYGIMGNTLLKGNVFRR